MSSLIELLSLHLLPIKVGAATCDLQTARMKGILSLLVDSFRQLPPSRSALYYHTLRSAYVSGHLWGQADLFAPELPAFVDWGWEEVLDLEDPNALILPTWSIMFDISGAYEKLSKTCNCGEKNGCLNRNCSCSGTRCLPTCKCRGECRLAEKTVRTKQVLLRLWTRGLKAVNLMRVNNEQLQICLDVNIVTLFC